MIPVKQDIPAEEQLEQLLDGLGRFAQDYDAADALSEIDAVNRAMARAATRLRGWILREFPEPGRIKRAQAATPQENR